MSYAHVGKYEGELRPLLVDAERILIGADGSITNFAGYKATRLEQQESIMEVFQPQLAGTFPPPWLNMLITQVLPNGCIPPHHDKPQEGTERYHLVLASNPLSWVMHDGDWQQLEAGHIYSMNPRSIHAAVNWGGMPRTHLVIDLDRRFQEDEG